MVIGDRSDALDGLAGVDYLVVGAAGLLALAQAPDTSAASPATANTFAATLIRKLIPPV
jgi:hypothetical protein